MYDEIKKMNIKNIRYNIEVDLCQTLISYFILKIKDNHDFLIKDKNGRKVYKFNYNKKTYYVKHYIDNYFLKNAKKIFRKSNAFQAFKKIKLLKKANISVVKPISALECKNNTSILITEGFGKNNLLNILSKENLRFDLKRKLIAEYAKIISELYNNSFLHKDPNLESISVNIIDSTEVKIRFVDIDEMIKFPYLPRILIRKNLAKINSHSYAGLYYNKNNTINFNDRLYFLKKFIKNYNKNINYRKLLLYIKHETVKTLRKWNKKDILKDEF